MRLHKLIGSPPGYLGHRETSPMLTPGEPRFACHTDDMKVSLVLVDEIEKASDSLWQLLLGILDKATLTLGDNDASTSRKHGHHDLEFGST
jgi:ATP-dependent Clp protease ATP-binding subunit ClpA